MAIGIKDKCQLNIKSGKHDKEQLTGNNNNNINRYMRLYDKYTRVECQQNNFMKSCQIVRSIVRKTSTCYKQKLLNQKTIEKQGKLFIRTRECWPFG